jgi:hypothetical protein
MQDAPGDNDIEEDVGGRGRGRPRHLEAGPEAGAEHDALNGARAWKAP